MPPRPKAAALLNRLRGLLGEFGHWPSRSADKLIRALPALSADTSLPDGMHSIVMEMQQQLTAIHERLARCDHAIAQHVKTQPQAQRMQEMAGIGTLTASAATATVVDAKHYRNGRQFAAWLGLVPRQMSSGGKTKLGRISRRGDAYLRSLLVQGARSTLQSALKQGPERATRLQHWIIEVYGRVGYHKTLIAIANKHARMLWAMQAKDEAYDPQAWQRAMIG